MSSYSTSFSSPPSSTYSISFGSPPSHHLGGSSYHQPTSERLSFSSPPRPSLSVQSSSSTPAPILTSPSSLRSPRAPGSYFSSIPPPTPSSSQSLYPLNRRKSSYIASLPPTPSTPPTSSDAQSTNGSPMTSLSTSPSDAAVISSDDATKYLATKMDADSQVGVTMTTKELRTLSAQLTGMLSSPSLPLAAYHRINASLHSLSFLLHLQNNERARLLHNEYSLMKRDIDEGRQIVLRMENQLAHHSNAIDSLHSTVDLLKTNVNENTSAISALNQNVSEQEAALQSAIAAWTRRLQEHQEALRRQDDQLNRLLSVRFRLDFGIDFIIVLISLYISRLSLISMTIRLFARLFLPRINPNDLIIKNTNLSPTDEDALIRHLYAKRRTKVFFFIEIIRTIIFLYCAKRLRNAALENGLHHQVGNWEGYANAVWQTMTFLLVPNHTNGSTNNNNNNNNNNDTNTPGAVTNTNTPKEASAEGGSSIGEESVLSQTWRASLATARGAYYLGSTAFNISQFVVGGAINAAKIISSIGSAPPAASSAPSTPPQRPTPSAAFSTPSKRGDTRNNPSNRSITPLSAPGPSSLR